MNENFCGCHEKHKSTMMDLKEGIKDCHDAHETMWESIKQKIDTKWLIVLIPMFVLWLGFQMSLYNTVKKVEQSVAVVTNDIVHIKKAIDKIN